MWFGWNRVAWAGLGLGVVGAVWGVLVEPSLLWLRTESIVLPAWRGAPLRVALVADLHAGAPFAGAEKMRRVAALVAAQKPDLVLLLGDYSINEIPGGSHVATGDWAPAFGSIAAPLGVFGVLGNHDWWNDTSAIREDLETSGVRVLENAALPLRSGSEELWLVGIGDTFTEHDRVASAFQGVPDGALAIVMSHGPDVTDLLAGRADLVVAGHTHGAQVYLPLISQGILNLRWRRGLYEVDGAPLYVTSGVGNSILPVRFGVPPEVVVLTLLAP